MKQFLQLIVTLLTITACDNLEPTQIDNRTHQVSAESRASGDLSTNQSLNTNNSNKDNNTNTTTNTDPKTAQLTPVFKSTSIAEGFGWLAKSTNTKKAFRLTTDHYYNLPGSLSERIARVLYTAQSPSESRLTADIRNWNKRPRNCLLELEQEFGGTLVDIILSDCFSPNRYGIQNCPNPEEQFLGIRDIRGFKNAFGVRLSCKGVVPYSLYRYAEDAGEQYHTVREIWLHPDSNHPYRVVLEGVATFTRSNANLSLVEALASTSNTTIKVASYENYNALSASPIKDVFMSYQLSGNRVRFPGTYIGQATCGTFTNEPTKIAGIFTHLMSLGARSETNSAIYYLNGSWVSNQPQRGGGVFAGGRFRNIDAFGNLVGALNVSYQPSDTPRFFEVSVNNTSPIPLIDSGYYNGTSVSNFQRPFFCFQYIQVLDFKAPYMRNLEPL